MLGPSRKNILSTYIDAILVETYDSCLLLKKINKKKT